MNKKRCNKTKSENENTELKLQFGRKEFWQKTQGIYLRFSVHRKY